MTTATVKVKTISPRTRVARLRKLRAFIAELPPRKFNMNYFLYSTKAAVRDKLYNDHAFTVKELNTSECGTVCCLGGWAVLLFDKKNEKVDEDTIQDRAQQLLGLDEDTAENLFHYSNWPASCRAKTVKKSALKALDILIERKGENFDFA